MADYGNRIDGTPKGNGYFGVLRRPDGKVSTEISVGVDIGDGEEEIPTLVPTLERYQVEHLLNGGEVTTEILDKAVAFARERKAKKLSPFASRLEEGSYKLPDK